MPKTIWKGIKHNLNIKGLDSLCHMSAVWPQAETYLHVSQFSHLLNIDMHPLTQVTSQGCCVISNKVNFSAVTFYNRDRSGPPLSTSGRPERPSNYQVQRQYQCWRADTWYPHRAGYRRCPEQCGHWASHRIRLGGHWSFLILGPGNQAQVG